jgi:hypothetical protein
VVPRASIFSVSAARPRASGRLHVARHHQAAHGDERHRVVLDHVDDQAVGENASHRAGGERHRRRGRCRRAARAPVRPALSSSPPWRRRRRAESLPPGADAPGAGGRQRRRRRRSRSRRSWPARTSPPSRDRAEVCRRDAPHVVGADGLDPVDVGQEPFPVGRRDRLAQRRCDAVRAVAQARHRHLDLLLRALELGLGDALVGDRGQRFLERGLDLGVALARRAGRADEQRVRIAQRVVVGD